jgi:hypothetical protein
MTAKRTDLMTPQANDQRQFCNLQSDLGFFKFAIHNSQFEIISLRSMLASDQALPQLSVNLL